MSNFKNSTIFILLVFSIIFGLFFTSISAASFSQVPQNLNPVIKKLLSLPEANALLEQVSQEGNIGIALQNDPSGQFDAMWDGDARLIKINPYRHSHEGSWICSILFELHNASTNRKMLALFHSAERNQISKEAWVEKMERMEHANALNTCHLIEKGIAQGIYPADAHWNIFQGFDDHYKLQQVTGHSQWFANKYDNVNPHSSRLPFQGTVSNLRQMSNKDKKNLENYLVRKNKKNTVSLKANQSFIYY